MQRNTVVHDSANCTVLYRPARTGMALRRMAQYGMTQNSIYITLSPGRAVRCNVAGQITTHLTNEAE